MPKGPLPDPHAVRRNQPTIPPTKLPKSGRKGPVPKLPAWSPKLGKAGRAWWQWAWRTPQACAWGPSEIDVVARRATLTDDLAIISAPQGVVLDMLEDDELRQLFRTLAALAAGKATVLKAMAECDRQLGFGSKNFLDLRWELVDDEDEERSAPTPAASGSRARLRMVSGGG